MITTQETTQEATQEITQETTQETGLKILTLLTVHPKLTRKEIADRLKDISEDGVKYHLAKLVKQGDLKRVGSTKGGYWQVLMKK